MEHGPAQLQRGLLHRHPELVPVQSQVRKLRKWHVVRLQMYLWQCVGKQDGLTASLCQRQLGCGGSTPQTLAMRKGFWVHMSSAGLPVVHRGMPIAGGDESTALLLLLLLLCMVQGRLVGELAPKAAHFCMHTGKAPPFGTCANNAAGQG